MNDARLHIDMSDTADCTGRGQDCAEQSCQYADLDLRKVPEVTHGEVVRSALLALHRGEGLAVLARTNPELLVRRSAGSHALEFRIDSFTTCPAGWRLLVSRRSEGAAASAGA